LHPERPHLLPRGRSLTSLSLCFTLDLALVLLSCD